MIAVITVVSVLALVISVLNAEALLSAERAQHNKNVAIAEVLRRIINRVWMHKSDIADPDEEC